MTKRKKRNAVTMVSLLLALSALIGIYIWYSNKVAVTDDAAEKESIALATVDTAKVTAIHYTGEDVDINLTLENGVWKSVEEPDRPINQEKVTSMLDAISEITADQKVVEAPDNLEDFGLKTPSSYLQVTLEDGSTVTLQLGNKAVTGDCYYALVNDDTTVYLVAGTYGTGLTLTNSDLTKIEASPEITAENITYLGIDNREGEDIELKNHTEAKLNNNGSTLAWEFLKPYGEGFTVDETALSSLLANYTSFDFTNCVDYKGDDLSKYGLDNPTATIDIGYTSAAETTKVNKEFKLYIGNQNDNNEYFVRRDGSNAVYTLSGDTIDKMLKVDAFSLLDHYACIPMLNSVDKLSAEAGGKTYNMVITRETVTNKDGEDETQATYYYDGNKAEESSFMSIYQALIAIKYDNMLSEAVDTSNLNPVLTLSYHIYGDMEGTITTSYLPYNDSFYLVEKGNVQFLVDKRVIDQIIETLSTYTGTTK